MLMDWLRGFISLTREFYLLKKKKKSVKPYPMKTTILTVLFFREFQSRTSAPNDSFLLSDQDTNRFLV